MMPWRSLTVLGTGLLVLWALAGPAAGQTVYINDECGFRIYVPTGWKALGRMRGGSFQFDYQFPASNGPPAGLVLDSISDIRWAASADLFAAAVVAVIDPYGIDIGRPEWVAPFSHGSLGGGYSIYRATTTRGGRKLPEGYTIRFFQYGRGETRGIVPNGYSVAKMWFWMPAARFHLMQPMIMAMMQTFEFTKAARGCWASSSSQRAVDPRGKAPGWILGPTLGFHPTAP